MVPLEAARTAEPFDRPQKIQVFHPFHQADHIAPICADRADPLVRIALEAPRIALLRIQ